MYKVKLRKTNREKRKLRVRKKVFGTAERPRLSVFRSNKYLYGQVIDDSKRITLVSITTALKDFEKAETKTSASFEAGKMLAGLVKDKKIEKLVVDRNGYKYHGRLKSFTDGLRDGGISI